jgi:hypothetical protein
MELMTYSDESLAERFDRIDERFTAVNGQIDDRVAQAVQQVLSRQERERLQRNLDYSVTGVIISLMGVIGAILVKGG